MKPLHPDKAARYGQMLERQYQANELTSYEYRRFIENLIKRVQLHNQQEDIHDQTGK